MCAASIWAQAAASHRYQHVPDVNTDKFHCISCARLMRREREGGPEAQGITTALRNFQGVFLPLYVNEVTKENMFHCLLCNDDMTLTAYQAHFDRNEGYCSRAKVTWARVIYRRLRRAKEAIEMGTAAYLDNKDSAWKAESYATPYDFLACFSGAHRTSWIIRMCHVLCGYWTYRCFPKASNYRTMPFLQEFYGRKLSSLNAYESS